MPGAGRCSSSCCSPSEGWEVAAPEIWLKATPSCRTPVALPSGATSEAAKGAETESASWEESSRACAGITCWCARALANSPGVTKVVSSPAATSTSPSKVSMVVTPSPTLVEKRVPRALTTASGVRTV